MYLHTHHIITYIHHASSHLHLSRDDVEQPLEATQRCIWDEGIGQVQELEERQTFLRQEGSYARRVRGSGWGCVSISIVCLLLVLLGLLLDLLFSLLLGEGLVCSLVGGEVQRVSEALRGRGREATQAQQAGERRRWEGGQRVLLLLVLVARGGDGGGAVRGYALVHGGGAVDGLELEGNMADDGE